MNEAVTTLEAVDIAAILKALPHRYPFLMVDRIVNMRGDESAVGIKNVTVNEPQFLGHFPGNPILPGLTAAQVEVSVQSEWDLQDVERSVTGL